MGKFDLKNWSFPNSLKFDTEVYCYILILILMFIFPRFLSLTFIWANLVPKSEVLQINWNLVQGYIRMCLFRFYCLFFQNFCHSYVLGKFGPKIYSSPNKLKFDTGVHCYMVIMILMFSFLKIFHWYNFGQIWAKSNVLHIDWNLIQGHIVTCWLRFWYVIFRTICHL